MLKLKDFDYHLPKELIAQKPIKPRDKARLMILKRKNKKIIHSYFYLIDKFLKKGDVLVFNNTKVLPAKIKGLKNNKTKIEILLIKPITEINKENQYWSKKWYILTNKKVKENDKIFFTNNLQGEILKNLGYKKIIKFNKSNQNLKKIIYKIGQPPLPPYIKEKNSLTDYQTVYAKTIGSIAAPTAGLHFTKRLLKKLKEKGIFIKYITLHVGLGTFLPVKTENIKDHKMEEELIIINQKTAKFLNEAKKNKQRIIAVGTTTTRALESMIENKKIKAGEKYTNLFIYPGFKFQFIDGLITNFHLPKSTLLMLVSAFAGRNFILKAYKQAILKKYRFYSFGDGMLIL